MIFVKR